MLSLCSILWLHYKFPLLNQFLIVSVVYDIPNPSWGYIPYCKCHSFWCCNKTPYPKAIWEKMVYMLAYTRSQFFERSQSMNLSAGTNSESMEKFFFLPCSLYCLQSSFLSPKTRCPEDPLSTGSWAVSHQQFIQNMPYINAYSSRWWMSFLY